MGRMEMGRGGISLAGAAMVLLAGSPQRTEAQTAVRLMVDLLGPAFP